MKQTIKNATGVHYLDVTVFATLDELIAVCGPPQYVHDVMRGSCYEWGMETEDGDIFVIYDKLDHVMLDSMEPITWRIGSLNYLTADTARSEINQALKQIRNEIPA